MAMPRPDAGEVLPGVTVAVVKVPVETNVYHTSLVQLVWPQVPVVHVWAEAATVVPFTQAWPVDGRETGCAVAQLSLAGCAMIHSGVQSDNRRLSEYSFCFMLDRVWRVERRVYYLKVKIVLI